MVLQQILFYLRLAVGLLTVWIVLTLFNKLGGFVWGFHSAGYGALEVGTTPSEALKSAMKETIEALVAIGFAVIVCCWHVIKEHVWRRIWRKEDRPQPGPGPAPDKVNRLRELIEKIRNLRR